MLKERICEKDPSLAGLPKNQDAKDRLVRVAIAVWEDFEEDLLQRLAESLERRLEAVIAADGWYTKY